MSISSTLGLLCATGDTPPIEKPVAAFTNAASARPSSPTFAATAVGLLGRESDILRKVIWWSLGMLAVLCLLIGLQSTPVLSWMLPTF